MTKTPLCLFLAVMLTVSCGFTPVYQQGNPAGEALQEISLASPQDKTDFVFVTAMQKVLPSATAKLRTLDYKIQISELLLSEGRIALDGKVEYTLRSAEPAQKAVSGQVRATISYSSKASYIANEAIKSDAIDRLMSKLAQALYHRLITQLGAP